MTATVIMNTYNERPDYLHQAIQSYLDQTSPVQLIVSAVDNDPNLDLIRSYPVQLVTKPPHEKSPSGSYKQLNNALKFISGDWFCFASSNDTAQPYKITMEIDACTLHWKDVCYSSYNVIASDGQYIKEQRFHPYNRDLHQQGNFVSDCALVSRRLIEKYTPFDVTMKNYAYWDLWLRIYEGEGNCFVYNPTPTWNYRQAADSMHLSRTKEQQEQHDKDRERMLSIHK